MHKKNLHFFRKIWTLTVLVILIIPTGCSKKSSSAKLKTGIQEINHKPFFINSLGMQFAPFLGEKTWLSIWETRIQDYAAYATNNVWQPAWFQDSKKHPAVNIQWEEAQAFCAWLTQRERQSGLLNDNEGYRLPTSSEWISALGEVANYPPETNSGNFGVSLKVDSFPKTSPVGSFPANLMGIHDLQGNVWEWCIAWPKKEGESYILHGGSWRDQSRKLLDPKKPLLVAKHINSEDYGFRCLLVLKRPIKL